MIPWSELRRDRPHLRKGRYEVRQKGANGTEPFTPKPLTPEQLNVIALLGTGTTDAEVAAAVGVYREAVWCWRHHTPLFIYRKP